MNPTVEAEQATRRAQVVEALADAVATVDRAPPIHVAVDGLADPATRTLADDLGRVLTGRGRLPRNLDLLPIPALTARTGTQPHQAGTEVGHECLALRSADPETSRLICRILSQELISIV